MQSEAGRPFLRAGQYSIERLVTLPVHEDFLIFAGDASPPNLFLRLLQHHAVGYFGGRHANRDMRLEFRILAVVVGIIGGIWTWNA
jgi:hypothetical protein